MNQAQDLVTLFWLINYDSESININDLSPERKSYTVFMKKWEEDVSLWNKLSMFMGSES